MSHYIGPTKGDEDWLKDVYVWVNIFWTPEHGYTTQVRHSEREALCGKGYGDYVGTGKVKCTLPKEAD